MTRKWGFLRCFVRSFYPHLDVWSCPHDCVLNIVFPTLATFNLNNSKYINISLPSTFKSSTSEKSLKHAYPKPKKITQVPWPSCFSIPQNDPKKVYHNSKDYTNVKYKRKKKRFKILFSLLKQNVHLRWTNNF